jgi:hypothetical protein
MSLRMTSLWKSRRRKRPRNRVAHPTNYRLRAHQIQTKQPDKMCFPIFGCFSLSAKEWPHDKSIIFTQFYIVFY